MLTARKRTHGTWRLGELQIRYESGGEEKNSSPAGIEFQSLSPEPALSQLLYTTSAPNFNSQTGIFNSHHTKLTIFCAFAMLFPVSDKNGLTKCCTLIG
jgi:hypothetical protein